MLLGDNSNIAQQNTYQTKQRRGSNGHQQMSALSRSFPQPTETYNAVQIQPLRRSVINQEDSAPQMDMRKGESSPQSPTRRDKQVSNVNGNHYNGMRNDAHGRSRNERGNAQILGHDGGRPELEGQRMYTLQSEEEKQRSKRSRSAVKSQPKFDNLLTEDSVHSPEDPCELEGKRRKVKKRRFEFPMK